MKTPEIFVREVAAKIVFIRKQRNLSIKELALIVSVSPKEIKRIESAEFDLSEIYEEESSIAKICSGLGIPPESLTGSDGIIF